jgi:hypothetical protein
LTLKTLRADKENISTHSLSTAKDNMGNREKEEFNKIINTSAKLP